MKKKISLVLGLWVLVLLSCSFFSQVQKQETPQVVISETESDPTADVVNQPTLEQEATTPPLDTIPTETDAAIVEGEVLPSVRIVAIHANSNINLAIDDQGRVWQWGNYKLGPANSPCKGGDACLLSPTLVPNLTDVAAVSAGYDHRMALKKDGSLWGWGQNETYQLGQGLGDKKFYEEAVPVPGMTEVASVSAGGNFTLALKKDGTVWAWGTNSEGQLGDGKDSYTPDYSLREESPFQVVNLDQVVAVDAGWHHGVALRADGTVWTWGFNQLGELGWGTADTEQHPVPAQVPGLSGVKTLGGGFSKSMVQTGDGNIWAWGDNLGGTLDASKMMDMQPHPNPILIAGLKDVVQFDACSMQVVALNADGTVYILGFGEIGPQTYLPQGQTVLKDIVAVSCGEDHMIALDKNGVVWAWGNNNVGQLGNGTMELSPSPQPVVFP